MFQRKEITVNKKRTILPIVIRQGDVLLQPADNLPSSMQVSPLDSDKSATVAHGEVTGHRHRFEFVAGPDGAALSRIYVHPTAASEVARIELQSPQALVHEEHSAHQVGAGVWRVSRPYEYEGAELIRMVAD
jgi:hypothetical protein